MYSENILRQLPCYHCVHCVGSKDLKRGSFAKRKCALTERWGSMQKAFYCTRFENKLAESSDEQINGYRIKKDQTEDFRTANQWLEAGYKVKAGEKGAEMYATRMAAMNNGKRFLYFLPEQVRPIDSRKRR